MQIGAMKLTINLDEDLAAELQRTRLLRREKPATVLQMAIRAGFPIVANRLQTSRPDGYLSVAYRYYPKERLQLESALAGTMRVVKARKNSAGGN
jgi:hypothetical protein